MTARAPRALVPLPRMTPPPMSAAAYDAALQALDAERAALTVTYVTSQIYPRTVYHATEPPQTIASDAEALALGEGWSAVPVAAPVAAPVVTALEPATAVLGSPSFTLHVVGTGFAPDAVIVWHGSDEPTTVVDPTVVTTTVNMDTAAAAVAVPVAVRNGDVVSNSLAFTFTEAPPETPESPAATAAAAKPRRKAS